MTEFRNRRLFLTALFGLPVAATAGSLASTPAEAQWSRDERRRWREDDDDDDDDDRRRRSRRRRRRRRDDDDDDDD